MSNNQRSSSFIAIRVALVAIFVGVCLAFIGIGTGAQKRTIGDREGRVATDAPSAPTSAFLPGDLAVVQLGDGATALSSSAAPVSVIEYTPAGVFVQSIPLNSAGASPKLTVTGTSGSEGHIVRSSNGNFLTLTGYDVAAGTATGFVAAGTNRTIARIGLSGVADLSTAFTDGSTGSVRSAVTSDGTNIWQTNGSFGVRYGLFGAVGASTQISSSPTSVRVTKIFNGQLYVSSASGTTLGVCTVGTGLPTTSGQTTTLLLGMPTSGTHSPYSFSINPAGTIMYVADDGVFGSGGGIQKWTQSGGTWSLAYTLLNTGAATTAVRGLTVDWIASPAIIYATTSAAAPDSLIKVVDTGAAATATTLVTAPGNSTFRGVDFVPGTPTAANVSISGRVTSSNGRGIRNARLTVRGNSLSEQIVVTTGAFGTYSVSGLQPGETYVITVNAKRFTFQAPSQVVTLNDNLTDVNFVAN